MGSYAIANYLDEQKVPTFTQSPNWDHTTIDYMLRNRATYGEYQPKSFAGGNKKGIPSGPPISNYYPAVVDKATFDAAQIARQQNLALSIVAITVLAFLAHPALLDCVGREERAALCDLVQEIEALSLDQDQRYSRRVNITVLLKQIVTGLNVHSAGKLTPPRHSSAQIRKDINGRFVEIQLRDGPVYRCISIG